MPPYRRYTLAKQEHTIPNTMFYLPYKTYHLVYNYK